MTRRTMERATGQGQRRGAVNLPRNALPCKNARGRKMAVEQTHTDNPSGKNHSIVARTLRNALTLADFEAWGAFSTIAAARLDERERAALAFAALKAQTPDHAEMTAGAAINGSVGTSFLDTPKGRAALIAWREQRDRRAG